MIRPWYKRWCPGLEKFIEYKHTYFGETKTFDCTLAKLDSNELVLLYKPQSPMRFIGLDFPPGSMSFGYYWVDRSYNVYHWKDAAGKTMLYYFNISRDTTISKDRVDWLDLVVDVAAKPHEFPRILDLEEVPTNMPIQDVQIVGETTKLIVSRIEDLERYLEDETNQIGKSLRLFSD